MGRRSGKWNVWWVGYGGFAGCCRYGGWGLDSSFLGSNYFAISIKKSNQCCPVLTTLHSGISKLCSLLSLDPYEDIRVLVLLWKLGATKKPAEIQRDEFISGSCNMGFDSIEKLKGLIPSLDTGFLDAEEFRDFYKVCFSLLLVTLLLMSINCGSTNIYQNLHY